MPCQIENPMLVMTRTIFWFCRVGGISLSRGMFNNSLRETMRSPRASKKSMIFGTSTVWLRFPPASWRRIIWPFSRCSLIRRTISRHSRLVPVFGIDSFHDNQVSELVLNHLKSLQFVRSILRAGIRTKGGRHKVVERPVMLSSRNWVALNSSSSCFSEILLTLGWV